MYQVRYLLLLRKTKNVVFDGFAIISAIDLQAPGWLVAVISVDTVAIGNYVLSVRKKTPTIQSM